MLRIGTKVEGAESEQRSKGLEKGGAKAVPPDAIGDRVTAERVG